MKLPEPHTAEFLAFMLITAMRGLSKEQMHNLAMSLAVRDPLFSVDEYLNIKKESIILSKKEFPLMNKENK